MATPISAVCAASSRSAAATSGRRARSDDGSPIAIGSSVQVALLVTPLLALASYAVGPAPMDLAFPGGQILTVLVAVVITGQVAGDGRSDWLKGVQLLAVYAILGLAYFFAPEAASLGS